MLVISRCGKMCGNELNLVNSFSVMWGWVEPALSKKWLCLLVLSADNQCKQFRSRSDPNKMSDLCFPLWCPFASPFGASPITPFVYLYIIMTLYIIAMTLSAEIWSFAGSKNSTMSEIIQNNWKTSHVRRKLKMDTWLIDIKYKYGRIL